jgi:hypothetical protein
MLSNWPGTPTHQGLRQAVAAHYANDQRVRAALWALLDVLEHDLPELSAGRASLSEGQRALIRAVRAQGAGC